MPIEAPKIEKLESATIDIVDYIGKLGKIFTTVLKSSKWSDKVVEDNRKEFIKIEKLIKENLKKENKEKVKVEEKPKGIRWQARNFFLTIPKSDASRSDVMNYYLNNMNIEKASVCREYHKDGTKHLHVYLSFTAKKDIKKSDYFNLPEEFKQYGNISVKVDTIKHGTKENVFKYMMKSDKNVISYGFNIRYASYGKLSEDDMWYKIAIGEWEFSDIVRYKPSLLKRDLKKLHGVMIDNYFYLKKMKIEFL